MDKILFFIQMENLAGLLLYIRCSNWLYKNFNKGTPGEPYNIGNSKPEISMKKLANLMMEVAKKKYNYSGKLVVKKNKDKNYLVDNPNRRCPDISKAKKELNFNPKINLLVGINKTLEWYKNNQ